MLDKNACVNDVRLIGRRSSDFSFSHRSRGTAYYVAEFASERLSGAMDWIPVRVSEEQREMLSMNPDGDVCIKGYFQSFNRNEQGRRRLLLSVFARTVDFLEEPEAAVNSIYLEGYVCRETIYRSRISPRREMILGAAEGLCLIDRDSWSVPYIRAAEFTLCRGQGKEIYRIAYEQGKNLYSVHDSSGNEIDGFPGQKGTLPTGEYTGRDGARRTGSQIL